MLFQEPWRCFCNFQSCSLFCRFSWCWNIQTPVIFYILSFLHVWSWVTSLWFEVSAPRRSGTHRWPHGENVMGKIWNMKWFSWRAEPKSPTKHLEDTDLQRYTKSPLLTFFPSFFYWWDLIMSDCTTKRTVFNNWNAPKMQRRQRKSKPVVDMAVLWASCSAHLLPVWFELCNVSTKACQSSPTQHSGFLLGRLSAWRSGPLSGAGPGWGSVGVVRDGVGSWGSDASELVPEAGRQDALHLLHDEVQRSEQRAEELQQRRKTQSYTNPETLQERLDRLSNISIRICRSISTKIKSTWISK